MLMRQAQLRAGQRVLVWGAAGGLGVFALQLCRLAGAQAVGVVSSDAKRDICRELGACDVIDRNEFSGMMRRAGETPEEEKARFKESRRFCKVVEEKRGGAPDKDNQHLGKIAILVGAEAEGLGRTADGPGAIRAEVAV
jgi:crotonyl-CoA carboxylase/reductase